MCVGGGAGRPAQRCAEGRAPHRLLLLLRWRRRSLGQSHELLLGRDGLLSRGLSPARVPNPPAGWCVVLAPVMRPLSCDQSSRACAHHPGRDTSLAALENVSAITRAPRRTAWARSARSMGTVSLVSTSNSTSSAAAHYLASIFARCLGLYYRHSGTNKRCRVPCSSSAREEQ